MISACFSQPYQSTSKIASLCAGFFFFLGIAQLIIILIVVLLMYPDFLNLVLYHQSPLLFKTDTFPTFKNTDRAQTGSPDAFSLLVKCQDPPQRCKSYSSLLPSYFYPRENLKTTLGMTLQKAPTRPSKTKSCHAHSNSIGLERRPLAPFHKAFSHVHS